MAGCVGLTVASVIAVPAVGADAVSTWKAAGRAWLEEELYNALPMARVLFYDHGDVGETDDLVGLADRLLGCIGSCQGGNRPLAFICHSTGGLVAKQALVRAGESQVEEYNDILTYCFGITFFAVPHFGSDELARPGLMEARQSGANYKLSITKSMRGQLAEGNKYLEVLADKFSGVSRKIRIWSFYETLGGDLGRTGEEDDDDSTVVSLTSAAFGLGIHAKPLPSDHFGIAAFGRRQHHDDIAENSRMDQSLSKYLEELKRATAKALWPSTNVLRNILAENQLFSRAGGNPKSPLEMESTKRSLEKLLERDFGDFGGQRSESVPDQAPSPTQQTRKDSIPSLGAPKKTALRNSPRRPSTLARERSDRGTAVSFEGGPQGVHKAKDNQKVTVQWIDSPANWSDKSERSETKSTHPYSFRWIHVPCTNVNWVETLLKGIAVDSRHPDLCDRFLHKDFWENKENRASHQSPHARYMHSTCEFIPKKPRKNSGDRLRTPAMDRVQLALYLPFLGWESFGRLQARAEVMKERLRLSEKARLEHELANSKSLAPDEVGRGRIAYPKQHAIPQDDLELEVLNMSPRRGLLTRLANSVELQLIWEYLMPGTDLHCRRSLDQFMYSTLPDTSDRDKDQVYQKRTRRESGTARAPVTSYDSLIADELSIQGIEGYDHGETGSVLVVDQLWLWVLDEGTVVTFFQKKEVDEGRDPRQEGDLFTLVRDHLSSETNTLCGDAWDVAALIVKHAVTALLDRVELTGPQVFRTFGGYIQELTDKQARSQTRLLDRDSGADETRGIEQIFEDLKALRELRDTDDELRMIEKILAKQIEHLEKMEKRFGGEDFRQRGPKSMVYITEAITRLKKFETQVKEMLENTTLARDAYTGLIDMKQKQVHIEEAMTANREAQISAEQSRAVMVFTVFTIIFLPLSFFATIFGMNAQEWSGTSTNISLGNIFLISAPISFVVIVAALYLALNSKADGEVIIECVIIALSFIGRWTAIDKILAAVGTGWRRIRPGWLSDFRKKVKRRREERISKKRGGSPAATSPGAVKVGGVSALNRTMSQREAKRRSTLQKSEEPAVIQILPNDTPAVTKAWRRGSAGRMNQAN
ncbi:MAG: hypothetical protein M1840_004745 [Geoglossum simile]|nr:MAG: hypothetical protein M1840_004745 [Geoglossum simile]